ncbi:3-hydroxyacyl-CoA dehydrogenase NAD-binding domain-containing protein [Shinella sp. 838]|jgi:3-hydroxyacyl-CoA dehydrogenase|uniref:3-hydroxyacyl-CoA dehydrogenase NAD-binding domain-containing protein n=1 Tax=unclassified Shinella TaxID=2643062 RepID=UPI0004379444|nr:MULTISPECIES: 3-hydroxyacyl-CoA dehydrogenase NAD-binding domain-containing protein [unclassified Shinella]EYR81553.1 fatty acid oxidation complex subunit alpha [Shinella sp. DD12]MCA0339466.1 enoyl-CoA hydratase/isomerase family protein [Pseudomonadota bacterium]MDG4674361.1 3-hydroxyacyl-CoA dehydrogenase NAD-binding domain-containing protein [Shinella sp. 838]
MTVNIDIDGGIAIVTIANPPVNAINAAVRERLLTLAQAFDKDPAIRAVILTGAGALFVAGADITEFDRPVEPPFLPDVVARIERAAKPWVAAIRGAALGGGLELVLGCRMRVATGTARFALPEVNLGIIPGSGGTQRLPRVIGIAEAIRVVAENHTLDAAEAVRLGLVDAIVEEPLLPGAIAFVRVALERALPSPTLDRPLSEPAQEIWTEAEKRIASRVKGASAPLQALEVLKCGVEQGAPAGLARERATFLSLRGSEEAAALRHLFFAERAAMRPADIRGTAPRPVDTAGVVGGGTMGSGIAAALLNAGLSVVLVEQDAAGVSRARETLANLFEASQRRGQITGEEVAERLGRLETNIGYGGVERCDVVIEAVFEELAVKRAVFAELGRFCRPDAILATNTSYIDPRLIAEGLPEPERFLGLHFFSPAHVMKLLEIVPTPETAPDVLATAFEIARRLGKIPVRAGICDGFIGNRILRRFRTEAEALVRDGVGIAAIDAAMRGFGFAMGPFEMQDMAGLDIAFLHREAARKRGEPVPGMPGDLLVRAGRKGQKTGGGWYDYAPGDRRPQPSAEAARILAPLMGPRTDMPGEVIVARLMAAMAQEGQAILAEGIAASAADIDLVEVHGYGFPRRRGGPMFQLGRADANRV